MKGKVLSILALLLIAVTGAQAQAETLLITINSTPSFTSGSRTFNNIATVTFSSEVECDDDEDGWYNSGWSNKILSVTPATGYTITKVKFYCESGSAFDETSPFEATLYANNMYVNGSSYGVAGVNKIEVYGYANAPATVDVTGVTLSQTSASMTVGGETLTLPPTVAPDDATDKTVTWASSDAAVATVADGVVTAVGAGTATITVTATNGTADTSDDKTATCIVTVSNPATQYDLSVGESEHGTVAFTVGGAAATQAKKDDVVTVSVTPDEGYSPKNVTVRAYISWETAPARALRAPALLDEIEVTLQQDGTWTFTMPEANVWIVATYTKNVQDAWIEAIADQTYTGSDIEPTVTVKDGETPLTLGADYTVAYSNNVETGTATVTVTGMGDYSGTATATFTIVADKSNLNDAISEAETYYNSIKDSNPAAAADLLTAINAAKAVKDNADATQAEVDAALTAISGAKTTAEQAVLIENSRVTITIPAKSYVARIDAEKRKIETAVEGVSLHTVTGVANSTVTLSDALTVVDAEMPYFIYNDNDEEKTVSILMSTEEANAVTVASEFMGTFSDKTFSAADMAAADHYVLTGKNFVWVKDAGTLAAGKCWIQLTKSTGARRLGIVIGGDATGIAGVSGRTADHNGWYDLNGRRLAGQPGVKGLYVVDGKKVVVK